MRGTGVHGRRPSHAAARGLLVLALAASACTSPPPHARESATTPLGGVEPSGVVSPPLTFRWAGNTDDAVVRVTVEDRAEREVFTFDSRGSSARAPDGLLQVLTPGEPFRWTVAVVGEGGTLSRPSKPLLFTRRDR